MAGKKINQLDVKVPVPTDLVAVGDQFTGVAGKSTCKQVVFAGINQNAMLITSSSFAYTTGFLNLVSNANNLSLGNETVHRCFSSGNYDITGIAPPTVGPLVPGPGTHLDGRIIYLINTGNSNISLKNQDALSTATNRFITHNGNHITLGSGHIVMAFYDIGITRWRIWDLT
jgi:hypothetical protein